LIERDLDRDNPYNRLARNVQRLRWTMLAGMVYDGILVAVGIVAPRGLLEWGGGIVPQQPFYLRFWSFLHLTLASFYFLAWMDVKRNIAIVAGAVVVRIAYAFFLFAALWLERPHIGIWAGLGAISLLLGISHYFFLRLSDFGLWEVLSHAGNPPGARRR
jgi:hypothetical protein